MKGGRAYWKIENETFNTLKNQGYNFDHNYGHGKKNLCSVFSMLMLLAFLLDQVQMKCCSLFQSARKAAASQRELWGDMRHLLKFVFLSSWDMLYQEIIIANTPEVTGIDSS